MPPKKSNLNNASSNGSRRKRVERAQQLPEQIETRNAAQRIRTAESRAQESQEQRDERLQQNITRTRAARERNIATVRVLDRQRQRISRSLTRASFVRLAFEYAPDINYSAHSKIAIGGMDKLHRQSTEHAGIHTRCDDLRIFKAKTLGRLYTVHPKQRECFYLRWLLVNVPGPTSFEFLRTVNGRIFNTYQDACRELQLLEDDNHWDLTLADAALTSTPNNIRQLFAIILTTCYPSQAQTLWEKYKNCMTEDILHRIRQTNQCQNIDYTPEMYNEALVLIEDVCVLISNLPLNHCGMPSPNRPATDLVNTDLQRENQYDHGSLATIIMNSEPLLTAEQKIIYDRIMLAVVAEQGGFFFLDSPGGTGKTFLISLILAKIRSQQKIALAVASSGIAATLLDGGRTAHSTFKLPLDVHNKPDAMCNNKKNSGIAAVLRKSSIIIELFRNTAAISWEASVVVEQDTWADVLSGYKSP
ncbi:unnamed protein product [Arctia plantaginis]|uniref:ATP-dependent DNA helicase n=1 Tax=Arctia plantaginis TaxID=874455 RepID=A0A8S1BQP4_ARCPL|nr:unnamed protein product [Arctia plantaginis]